jgi:hypothetical protein
MAGSMADQSLALTSASTARLSLSIISVLSSSNSPPSTCGMVSTPK